MKIKYKLITALLAGVVAISSQAAPFTNGGFDIPPQVKDYIIISDTEPRIAPWMVTKGNVDLTGSGWEHDTGIGSIDLLGWKHAEGQISQTFDVIPGKTYKVGFAMSGNGWGGPTLKIMDVSVLGSNLPVLTYEYDTAKNSGWKKHSFEFVALNSQATLSFKGYVEGKVVCDFGPRLDSVTVEAVDGSDISPEDCCRKCCK